MKLYKVGDASRAICPFCKTLRATTFQERDVPLSSGKGTVTDVLVAECDVCHRVVSVPQQSVPRVAEARARARHPLEARVPRHLIDAINVVSSELGYATGATALIFRFYLKRLSSNPTRLKKLSASADAEGKATARFSAKLSDSLSDDFDRIVAKTHLTKADVVRGVLAGIKQEVLDAPAGPLRSELREILAVASD